MGRYHTAKLGSTPFLKICGIIRLYASTFANRCSYNQISEVEKKNEEGKK